jgi:hypothetical protein
MGGHPFKVVNRRIHKQEKPLGESEMNRRERRRAEAYVRFSSELPDDVGRVFATAVPNAPFQLTGRRDPANGELCIGRVVRPPKDMPWPPSRVVRRIEVVTGPEAERLILSVHRWVTERADAKGLTFDEYMESKRIK